jgi:hypothetical protein
MKSEKYELLYTETIAYYFSKYIPYSSMKVLPNVGHFIFINELSTKPLQHFNNADAKRIQFTNTLGAVCYTQEERKKINQLTGELAIRFFGNYL